MVDFPSILATMPAADLFVIPPAIAPTPLPPVAVPTSIMRPFNIPDNLYLATLDARVPLTIAATYAVTAKLLNKYNKARGKQPWGISKTRAFHVFVVLHNIFLAVYSAWTFWGMLGVMRRSVASPFGPGGIAATADSLCRIQGPTGLGNSIYFNDTTASWDSASPSSISGLLSSNGLPSSTEMGRMWNEGLAYYGWIFYLSKFYEVLDTFIILAKGKYSSTLQTYHHAGAMMCMWAGIRYMSVPIWVFCFVNSFIHALMYTYYTVSAFNVKVPMAMKRGLTTMQITQFVLGASYTILHSFVTYIVPTTAERKDRMFGSSNGGAMAPVPSGVARRSPAPTEAAHLAQPCIATSSETFAIWLNVFFFISSYVKRSNAAQKLKGKSPQQMSDLAEKAGWDAARDVEREVYGGERMTENASPKSRSPVRRLS
ncbi:Putative elongation of fatty acids protein [Cladobotryum mycophilum]|uniref:Elongation of fatty acids protein n=1 Tax=Cladobotryum mycophilum TaxID=491253 RepID=A0ABR0SDP1_9HYPO